VLLVDNFGVDMKYIHGSKFASFFCQQQNSELITCSRMWSITTNDLSVCKVNETWENVTSNHECFWSFPSIHKAG
jgi:hypothetical protein